MVADQINAPTHPRNVHPRKILRSEIATTLGWFRMAATIVGIKYIVNPTMATSNIRIFESIVFSFFTLNSVLYFLLIYRYIYF